MTYFFSSSLGGKNKTCLHVPLSAEIEVTNSNYCHPKVVIFLCRLHVHCFSL